MKLQEAQKIALEYLENDTPHSAVSRPNNHAIWVDVTTAQGKPVRFAFTIIDDVVFLNSIESGHDDNMKIVYFIHRWEWRDDNSDEGASYRYIDWVYVHYSKVISDEASACRVIKKQGGQWA